MRSFTHSWLSRMKSLRLPVSFGRVDIATLFISGVALLLWIVRPGAAATDFLFLTAAISQAISPVPLGGDVCVARAPRSRFASRICFYPSRFSARQRLHLGARNPCRHGVLHVWTVGAIGVMTLGVMTRATRGHTGRNLTASTLHDGTYGAMILAAVLRIAAGFIPEVQGNPARGRGRRLDRGLRTVPYRIYAPMLIGQRLEPG